LTCLKYHSYHYIIVSDRRKKQIEQNNLTHKKVKFKEDLSNTEPNNTQETLMGVENKSLPPFR